ncbi:hypothetical protein CL653_01845 [bacterium]|nr:hypothetical protein [bacterium]
MSANITLKVLGESQEEYGNIFPRYMTIPSTFKVVLLYLVQVTMMSCASYVRKYYPKGARTEFGLYVSTKRPLKGSFCLWYAIGILIFCSNI